ncbi:galacturonan 1,4-alpha-galacturonidase [Sarracenia purpurea var. burkii]
MSNLRSSSSSCLIRPRIIIFAIFYISLFSNFKSTEGFDSVIQLPHSRDSRNQIRSKRVFNVQDYGAKGDGLNDDTQAFKDAWKLACSSSSQSQVEIPAGNTYLVRPIDFGGPCQSKLTLKISGTIIAPKDPDVWDGLNPQKWLYFHGVIHLTVEGGGIIDGMGQECIGSLGKSDSLVQVHDVSVDGAFLSNTENGVRMKTWQTSSVKVEDISFMAIKGTSATKEAIKFACSDSFPCERLYLEDIQLVSFSGGPTKSFCWQAQGSSSEPYKAEKCPMWLFTGFS